MYPGRVRTVNVIQLLQSESLSYWSGEGRSRRRAGLLLGRTTAR